MSRRRFNRLCRWNADLDEFENDDVVDAADDSDEDDDVDFDLFIRNPRLLTKSLMLFRIPDDDEANSVAAEVDAVAVLLLLGDCIIIFFS